MFHHKILGANSTPYQTFAALDLENNLPSIDQLDTTLVANSISVNPTGRYKGGDADATDWDHWTYGEDLTASAAGSLAFNQGNPLFGSNDDSVKGDGTNYYYGPDNSFGEITTEDFCLEIIFKSVASVGTSKWWGGKFDLAPAIKGYLLYDNNSDEFRCYINDGAGHSAECGTSALTDGCWYHAIVFCDRSENSTNGFRMYLNGALATLSANPSTVGSLTTATTFQILAADSQSAVSGSVAYVAMYKQASWFAGGATNATEWLAIAQERFSKLVGLYPQLAKGTYAPASMARTTCAYLDKYIGAERFLFKVGANWIRSCHRKDASTNDIYGVLIERNIENKCLNSEVFSSWTKEDAGDTISNNVVSVPSLDFTGDSITADNTDGQHGVSQDITLTAAKWVFSVWIKKGNKDWVCLEDETIANGKAYFDLTNGVIGTKQAGLTESGIDTGYYDGWCRCWISFTGTAAAHTMTIRPADGDDDDTIQGDSATKNIYLWGAMCHLGDFPTSYFATEGSALTRGYDSLYYKADDGNIGGVGSNKKGTAVLDILCLNANIDTTARSILTLTDGGSINDRMQLDIDTNNHLSATAVAATVTTVSIAGTSDIADGDTHEIRFLWQLGSSSILVDRVVENGTVTPADLPDDLDRLIIGSSYGGSNGFDGLIKNLKIYITPTLKG